MTTSSDRISCLSSDWNALIWEVSAYIVFATHFKFEKKNADKCVRSRCVATATRRCAARRRAARRARWCAAARPACASTCSTARPAAPSARSPTWRAPWPRCWRTPCRSTRPSSAPSPNSYYSFNRPIAKGEGAPSTIRAIVYRVPAIWHTLL